MTERILVVDDEVSIRHMLSRVLSDEHYQVETAGTVWEALKKLEVTTFDLAIVDLFLPGLNGLNLAEAIRMLDPETPVILITAYGAPSFESMACHPAILHYVHKPFSLERLLALVRQSLSAGPQDRDPSR
jgi:DNA-binding NtrC family response regulator